MTLYKFMIYCGGTLEEKFFFREEDLQKVENHVKKFLLKEMKSYKCDGCSYCVGGSDVGSDKKWCGKRFTNFEDLPQYLHMCKQRNYAIEMTIHSSYYKPYYGGDNDDNNEFMLEKGLHELWCLAGNTGYYDEPIVNFPIILDPDV